MSDSLLTACGCRSGVTFVRHSHSHFVVELLVGGSKGRETVDIAVVHAECGCDQNGIVDLEVGGAFDSGLRNIFGGDVFSALLHLRGDGQQAFSFALTGAVR